MVILNIIFITVKCCAIKNTYLFSLYQLCDNSTFHILNIFYHFKKKPCDCFRPACFF
jgi:hypothetical protein